MSRRLVNVTLDNLSELPVRCRSCVFWELDPAAGEQAAASGDGELEKEAWVSDTLLQWGSCGQLAYVDGNVAGFVLYAPPAYVPRSDAFATSPVAADAVLLMTARVLPAFAGAGLGRVLVQTVAREVMRRGYRAVEAFGDSGLTGAGPLRRRHGQPDVETRPAPGQFAHHDCVLPADYLRAVGFRTVRAHPVNPRLRLDVRSTVTWRADVESAIERLFGSIQSPVLSP